MAANNPLYTVATWSAWSRTHKPIYLSTYYQTWAAQTEAFGFHKNMAVAPKTDTQNGTLGRRKMGQNLRNPCPFSGDLGKPETKPCFAFSSCFGNPVAQCLTRIHGCFFELKPFHLCLQGNQEKHIFVIWAPHFFTHTHLPTEQARGLLPKNVSSPEDRI